MQKTSYIGGGKVYVSGTQSFSPVGWMSSVESLSEPNPASGPNPSPRVLTVEPQSAVQRGSEQLGPDLAALVKGGMARP